MVEYCHACTRTLAIGALRKPSPLMPDGISTAGHEGVPMPTVTPCVMAASVSRTRDPLSCVGLPGIPSHDVIRTRPRRARQPNFFTA